MAETQTQEEKLINKELVFHAKKTDINYESQLAVRIKVEQSYFSKLQIDYYENEGFISGYYHNMFTIVATGTDIHAMYEKSFANAKLPPVSEKSRFEYDKQDVPGDPEFWEEKYLSGKWIEKWESNDISEDEAKQMILDLVDFFEPEDFEDVERAALKAMFKKVKEVINDNTYIVDVDLGDQ